MKRLGGFGHFSHSLHRPFWQFRSSALNSHTCSELCHSRGHFQASILWLGKTSKAFKSKTKYRFFLLGLACRRKKIFSKAFQTHLFQKQRSFFLQQSLQHLSQAVRACTHCVTSLQHSYEHSMSCLCLQLFWAFFDNFFPPNCFFWFRFVISFTFGRILFDFTFWIPFNFKNEFRKQQQLWKEGGER